jgi:hypothetical protein
VVSEDMKTIISMMSYKKRMKKKKLPLEIMIMLWPYGCRKCMMKEKKKEPPLEMIMKASKLIIPES